MSLPLREETLGRLLRVGKDMLEEDNQEACCYELINLGSSEVFAVAHHFLSNVGLNIE